MIRWRFVSRGFFVVPYVNRGGATAGTYALSLSLSFLIRARSSLPAVSSAETDETLGLGSVPLIGRR